ncbi:MAG: hypothetical protein QMD92_00100 [bacterium]|nr:hypothetical protein [bacterium]
MKTVLEQFLIREFPELYVGVYRPLTENLMSFGFECSDGWFALLYDLSRALTKLDEGVVATQVKEKYGTLRFYIEGGSDEVFELIDKAEGKSATICEICGELGKLRSLGTWLKTLCDEHYKAWVMGYLEPQRWG